MTVYDESGIEFYEGVPERRDFIDLTSWIHNREENHDHLIEIYEDEHLLKHNHRAIIHSILKRNFL